MRFRLMITAAALATLPSASIAQQLPADCSKAATPKRPLEVSVGGARFKPKIAKLIPAGGLSAGQDQFDLYRLALRSEDEASPPLEAEVTLIVRRGQRIDGKTFRRLPVREVAKQPAVFQGLPEVQGWSFRNRTAKTEFTQAEHIGSLRLEFGKREGLLVVGSIYLCVPRGQTAAANKTPTKQESFAIGTFQARIEPN